MKETSRPPRPASVSAVFGRLPEALSHSVLTVCLVLMPASVPAARDLMTDSVLAARADWSLSSLASFLTTHDISGAPVVSDQGRAIGVVSLRDLVRHGTESASADRSSRSAPASSDASSDDGTPPAFYLGRGAEAPDVAAHDLPADAPATVRDIMMPIVVGVDETTSVYEVARRMARGRLHRLLVFRPGTQREVTGLLSAIDVLDWMGRQAPAADEHSPGA